MRKMKEVRVVVSEGDIFFPYILKLLSLGIKMRLTDEQKIEIVKKYLQGDSSRKLGKEYGVDKNSILSILKVRGIIRRDKK
jgi:transposase-like protein